MSKLRQSLSDFLVRQVVDFKGESSLVFGAQKRQKPIESPAAYGLGDFQTIHIRSADGTQLALWYKPPTDPTKPIYVAHHGRRGNWGFASNYPVPKNQPVDHKDQNYRNQWLRAMADTGAGVVAVHTRGFGASDIPGFKRHTLRNINEDAEAVSDFLRGQNLPHERLVIAGESMGGALAALLCATLTDEGRPPKMLALVNTFSDMSTSIHEQIINAHLGKFRPMKDASLENTRKRFANPFDTVKAMDRMTPQTHLYVAHTPNDELMNLDHTQRVLKAGQDNQMNNTFRVLVGPFLRPLKRLHTAWDPQMLVKDMESVYYGREKSMANASFR